MRWIFTMLCCLGLTDLFAQEMGLAEFIQGKYQIVGRKINSDDTYTGFASVQLKEDGSIEITRTIGKKKIQATGAIVPITADSIEVFRLQFKDGKKEYEGTFLIHTDLDNYGRLSGYLYLKNGETKSPGLEAWFIDHGQ